MSAQVISFKTAVIRMRIKRACRNLKPLVKCEPSPMRQLIRADADQAIEELAREPLNTCHSCGTPISSTQTLALKHYPHGVAVLCRACAVIDADELPEPIEFCKSVCWRDCHLCFQLIRPGDHVVIDGEKGAAHYGCFDRSY